MEYANEQAWLQANPHIGTLNDGKGGNKYYQIVGADRECVFVAPPKFSDDIECLTPDQEEKVHTCAWHTGCHEDRTSRVTKGHFTIDGDKTLCGIVLPSSREVEHDPHGWNVFCKKCDAKVLNR